MLGSFIQTYEAFTNKKFKDIFLVWVFFICGWAMFLQFIPTFLMIHLNYNSVQIGSILAFMGGTFACTQIFIARSFLKRFSPQKVLRYSMIIPSISALGIIFFHNMICFYVAAFLFPFSMGFTLPALIAAISNRGNSNTQGKLLGMAQSLQALMTIVATLLGGELISMSSILSSLVGSALMFVGYILFRQTR